MMTSKIPVTPDRRLGANQSSGTGGNSGQTQQRKLPSENSGNVKVVCRFRPMNQKEEQINNNVCVDFLDKQTVLYKGKEADSSNPNSNKYILDRIFPMDTLQEEIYEFAARPVVDSVLEGFNGTIFAYGQTSSGKTHTMQGVIDDDNKKGIVPRMVSHVFDTIEFSPDHIEFRIKVSIVEIYMEKIRDLLDISKTNLKIREDKSRGVYIQDVTEKYVSEEQEVYDIMKAGANNRAISATNMNEGSSRSHSLFFLTISQNNLNDLSAKTGKLCLVDLAGSEKVGKTGAAGQTLEEAKKINKSLSSLGNVINALTDGKSMHIPYRDAKLTRVLQESLGGNSRTTLIITCSPSCFNESETLSTLKFGCRAKSIKNKPKINREITVAELQLLLQKAEKLIESLNSRVRQLEEFITKLGSQPPHIEEWKEAPIEVVDENKKEVIEKDSEEEDEDEEAKPNQDQAVPIFSDEVPSSVFKNQEVDQMHDYKEKIEILERELETQLTTVKKQNEKLLGIRKEFALLNAKSVTQEKENESLIHKLANNTLKVQEKDDIIKDQEDQIETLNGINQNLLSEIEEIQKMKQDIIKDKNQEIENQLKIIEQYKQIMLNAGSDGRTTNSLTGSPSKSTTTSKVSSPGSEVKDRQSLHNKGEDLSIKTPPMIIGGEDENIFTLLFELNERKDKLFQDIQGVVQGNPGFNKVLEEVSSLSKTLNESKGQQPFAKGNKSEAQNKRIDLIFEILSKKDSLLFKVDEELKNKSVSDMIERHNLETSKIKPSIQRLLGNEQINQKLSLNTATSGSTNTPGQVVSSGKTPWDEKSMEALIEMNKRKDLLLSKIFTLEKNNNKLNKLLDENSNQGLNLAQEMNELYANPPEYIIRGINGIGQQASSDKNTSVEFPADLGSKRTTDADLDLKKEKEKNDKLKKDLSSLKHNYEKLLNGKIPLMDEIKKAITKDVQEIERKKFEREKSTILKDLHNRVNKVVDLEMQIDELKTQNTNMENFMSQGEKALKKKVNSLENNLEQLTVMYHQLLSQRSHLKVDNTVNEKKLKRKNDKIFQLENELNETKEQFSIIKSKYDQLTAMCNQNEFGTHFMMGSLLNTDLNYFPSVDLIKPDEDSRKSFGEGAGFGLQEKNEKQESHPNRMSWANPARIVKTIKGGTKLNNSNIKANRVSIDIKKSK